MTALLKLVEYKCRDTVSILKALLSLALQGRLRGLVVCYKDDDGEEHTVFTGAYKEHPGKAAGVALRMSLTLMQASSDME